MPVFNIHDARPSITVAAPARLHMGFLDLNGDMERCFGGLGLALNELATTVSVHHADQFSISGAHSDRAEKFARSALSKMGIEHDNVQIQIHQEITPHAGLGSGTQLALSIGTALSRLYRHEWTATEVACAMQRAARSGIGLGLFEQGGFIVDGGRKTQENSPAPVISRMKFPAAWRIILIFDPDHSGIHGKEEIEAFSTLSKQPAEQAAHLCRLTLMQVLPALAEENITEFGHAISEIQAIVGDHFSQTQDGRFASKDVASALDWFEKNGAAGVGQSSWGPTGFALIDSQTQAQALVKNAKAALGTLHPKLEFIVCSGNNKGANIQVEHPSKSTHKHQAR